MKRTVSRRRFLEKFAKASTATLAVGICVACPAPRNYYPTDFNDIEIREIEYEGSVLDVHLLVHYLDNEETLAKIETLQIKSEDDVIIAFNKTIKESTYIDRLSFEITFENGTLEYETQYSVMINTNEVIYNFKKKF